VLELPPVVPSLATRQGVKRLEKPGQTRVNFNLKLKLKLKLKLNHNSNLSLNSRAQNPSPILRRLLLPITILAICNRNLGKLQAGRSPSDTAAPTNSLHPRLSTAALQTT
jgi:hypothetical protein